MTHDFIKKSALDLLVSAIDQQEDDAMPSPIELLRDYLAAKFPDAHFEIRKPNAGDDVHYMNIYYNELEVAVQWSQGRKIGLSCFTDAEDELDGLYAAPDEWFKSTEAAYHRIASLLLEEQPTREVAANLSQLRQALGMSQISLSAMLAVQQATYSKLERRSDIKISTLRKVIEAMGGTLKMEASFPESQDVRELRL